MPKLRNRGNERLRKSGIQGKGKAKIHPTLRGFKTGHCKVQLNTKKFNIQILEIAS